MVKMVESSGNSPEITLQVVGELQKDVRSSEDQTYLDGMKKEALELKNESSNATRELLGRMAQESKEAQPDDWQSNPNH